MLNSLLFPQAFKEYHNERNLNGNLLAINVEYADRSLVDLVRNMLPKGQAWIDPTKVLQTAPNISLAWQTLPINHHYTHV